MRVTKNTRSVGVPPGTGLGNTALDNSDHNLFIQCMMGAMNEF